MKRETPTWDIIEDGTRLAVAVSAIWKRKPQGDIEVEGKQVIGGGEIQVILQCQLGRGLTAASEGPTFAVTAVRSQPAVCLNLRMDDQLF